MLDVWSAQFELPAGKSCLHDYLNLVILDSITNCVIILAYPDAVAKTISPLSSITFP